MNANGVNMTMNMYVHVLYLIVNIRILGLNQVIAVMYLRQIRACMCEKKHRKMVRVYLRTCKTVGLVALMMRVLVLGTWVLGTWVLGTCTNVLEIQKLLLISSAVVKWYINPMRKISINQPCRKNNILRLVVPQNAIAYHLDPINNLSQ